MDKHEIIAQRYVSGDGLEHPPHATGLAFIHLAEMLTAEVGEKMMRGYMLQVLAPSAAGVHADMAQEFLDAFCEEAKPAPAPGAEAAIEALALKPNTWETLEIRRAGEGYEVRLFLGPDKATRKAVAPTLSAALAALRGEAGK